MEKSTGHLKRWADKFDKEQFNLLNEEISFAEYIDKVYETPAIVRTAYQRLYDMIISKGSYEFEWYRKKLTHYNFFDDPEYPIFGLEETLDRLVTFINGAAGGHGPEKRVLLLHGPVGSSKSTICRRLKRGMEAYSKLITGAWYSFKWINLPTGPEGIYLRSEDACPMHEEPLKLMPLDMRQKALEELNEIHRDQYPEEKRNSVYTLKCNGELDPRCKKFMKELMDRYKGDWNAVIENHIRVVRKHYSESDRCGIATFQPKDEKNQDATELTGDVDYSKLPHFGCDSDPRAFTFDGEFCVGNRGATEFIEIFKLAQEFLYDLLGATQEQQIKPKKFAQISIDEAIIGHCNLPDYEKIQSNRFMEALKDRTFKIDVPYLLKWGHETKVLEQDYNKDKVRQHIAPHTIEIAALWAVLTRLEDDKDGRIDLVQKAKLYNGEVLQGFSEETIKELKDKYPTEGMKHGVSARYVQDKFSNCLSSHYDYISAFMVMHEIKEGLDNYCLINDKELLARYHTCVDLAVKELNEILKGEVRKALIGDEKAIIRLCSNYIDNLMAYLKKSKVKNQYTQRDEPPNERLMRSIEEKIGIPNQGVDDFRRMVAAFIGDLAHEGKQFAWNSNADLKKALEDKLYEDTKDHIKISALHVSGASVVQPDLQEKIDAIKKRLIAQYGYTDKSAADVLDYVGSLHSGGDQTEER
jgi:serine protein kinase